MPCGLASLVLVRCRDPYKTLFVARISFDTTEKKLKREFEQFGPVKSIR
jgi:U1 small nuclear ribonucleoprotein 70kDa